MSGQVLKADKDFIMNNLMGTIPTEIANDVIKGIVKESTAFRICKHIPMQSNKKTLQLLTDTGTAYWTEESERIGTSVMNWEYPKLQAKKLAVIVPTTKEKIKDSVINVMSEIKDGIKDAFTRAIDSAILFGTKSPFDTNIYDAAKSNNVKQTGKIDLDISNAMALVENSDISVNAIITHNGIKNSLRTLRDSNGNALIIPGGLSGTQIYQTPIYIPSTKSFDKEKATFLIGNFDNALIGTREDMEYEVLTEATLFDEKGVPVLNLAQNDMLAIKVTMRFGFNVITNKAFSCITAK
ncbi:phage major capsid protein [Clostridium novyi]|uniref:Phage capsid family protein, putative n=1 Tax=Clostridium novyi (strain NT) TaxID=386415 RepID=A0Q3S4_CLONN|nr:phage major capsid protein [Clostridium novyi]ABK62664.1 Phage capsid family protein, putative [Clostridium novyi NT]KEH85287.1 hypothetical protein Z966_07640 [Clostridium novyi A str. NCTC 538]